MKKCTHKYIKGDSCSIQTNAATGYLIKVVIFCEKCGEFKTVSY